MTNIYDEKTGKFIWMEFRICVWTGYSWQSTHEHFDTEEEAIKFIQNGKVCSNGKLFTIMKKFEKCTPTKRFFIRKTLSSKKETPVSATKKEKMEYMKKQ